jgi:leucyl-tRNA synthetase
VVRAYLMFIGPFDATMAWNERALAGVRRFLERFERFITENAGKHSTASYIARVETNRVIKGVTEDIPQFKFNTALAKMMEGLNTLIATAEPVRTNELRTWLQLLAPIAPFLAETLWQKIGQAGSVHTSGWPEFDQTLVEEEKLEIPVQVNGRLRGVIRVNRDDTEEQVRMQAEALDTVQKYLRERTLQKVIYIPGRTLNFVVR